MEIIPILLEAFQEAISDELAVIYLMATAGAFLLATSIASLMLAYRGV